MTKPTTESEPTTETHVPLVGGQELTIARQETRNLLVLRGPNRRVTLTIEVTEQGPILRFDGPGLAIETTGALSLQAETLSLHGRQGLELSSGGDAVIQVEGDLET